MARVQTGDEWKAAMSGRDFALPAVALKYGQTHVNIQIGPAVDGEIGSVEKKHLADIERTHALLYEHLKSRVIDSPVFVDGVEEKATGASESANEALPAGH